MINLNLQSGEIAIREKGRIIILRKEFQDVNDNDRNQADIQHDEYLPKLSVKAREQSRGYK